MAAYLNVTCDRCGHEYHEPVQLVDDISTLREQGWVIDLQTGHKDRCPDCARNKAVKTALTKIIGDLVITRESYAATSDDAVVDLLTEVIGAIQTIKERETY